MGKKIVIALGGNALGDTAIEQLKLVEETAKPIVDLIEDGNQVVIAHGNGPQVGMINLGMNYAHEQGAVKGEMPFPECGAMSQGYIGYHLQNAIGNELKKRGIKKDIACVITQVIVDEKDPAFSKPTKPVGAFYDKETADKMVKERGWTVVEDAGRGYRRVVASPKPIDVAEKNIVNNLIDNGYIVITVGGGGIPVIDKDNKLVGVPAVIDKDFASAKLAEIVKADSLFILTAVERVCINYGKPDEKQLEKMTIEECEKYIGENQFAPGSMLPKVIACMGFAKTGGEAIIADLKNAKLALKGESGTKIVR
ncbi:MAG: carbamate kinase [Lachnospiraceae bacterium]|nr:carbamate kinase [Lachnospiraceae bacterium]